MKYTTHLELQFQTTRLVEDTVRALAAHSLSYGTLTLYGVLFQGTLI